MTVSNINSSLSSILAASSTGSAQAVRPDRDGDHDGSGMRPPGVADHRSGGPLVRSLMQALSQLGLGGMPQRRASAATGADSDGDNDGSGRASAASGNSSVAQAMQSFLHALLQTLRQEQSGAAANGSASDSTSAQTTSAAAPYSQVGTDLQALIQQLGNGTPGSQSSNVSGLQSAYNNLVSALQSSGTGSTGSSNTAPHLQAVLQAMLQDLPANQRAPVSALGESVNIVG
jgi:hypothetical protein